MYYIFIFIYSFNPSSTSPLILFCIYNFFEEVTHFLKKWPHFLQLRHVVLICVAFKGLSLLRDLYFATQCITTFKALCVCELNVSDAAQFRPKHQLLSQRTINSTIVRGVEHSLLTLLLRTIFLFRFYLEKT